MAKTKAGYVVQRRGERLLYEHRMVWEAAYGAIPEGFHIHHKNGVRDDNRIENLELRDGRDHSRHHTTKRHREGSLNNRRENSGRWLDLDADYLRQRRDEGVSINQLAKELGVGWETVARRLSTTS